MLADDLTGATENGAAAIETGAIWQRMAERVAKSWQTVPHFFLVREVDASRLEAWRQAARGRPGGEGVTHTDLLVRISAAAMATKVRMKAARSASASARDLELCACSTRRMMPASVVWSPVPVTRTRRDPDPFTVPAMTCAPTSFRTGADSPVSSDSFTSLLPLSTVPSAGTADPGRTKTRSPIRS